MSDQPKGKDGFFRVLARMKLGYKKWRRGTEQYREEFFDEGDGHDYVDIFVEGDRIPDRDVEYFTGHMKALASFLIPALGILSMGLIFYIVTH